MKVDYVHHCGSDLTVVNAARVSFAKESFELDERDAKLINYLASHKHTSPFNHSFITMRVKAPIFVARQLVKHKFMPWNEVSRRYVDDPPEFYFPDYWRPASKDKKQGSGEGSVETYGMGLYTENWFDHIENSLVTYESLLHDGVAPEQARMILPQNTYTEWYWSGTLGAWMDMYNLRAKPDAQQETQEIAFMCGEIIQGLFPYSFEELSK